MLPLLAGPSSIYGAGMLELGMSFSMEQLVIDNDIIGMSRFAKKGIKVDDETIAYDAIKEIGAGGDFLGHVTTLMNVDMPSHTKILDRQMYGGWDRDGRRDTADIAHDVVAQALANPPLYPVSDDVLKAIDEIIARKEKELGC